MSNDTRSSNVRADVTPLSGRIRACMGAEDAWISDAVLLAWSSQVAQLEHDLIATKEQRNQEVKLRQAAERAALEPSAPPEPWWNELMDAVGHVVKSAEVDPYLTADLSNAIANMANHYEDRPSLPPTANIETAVRGWIDRRRKELSKSGITGGHYVADLCLLEEVLEDCLRGLAETKPASEPNTKGSFGAECNRSSCKNVPATWKHRDLHNKHYCQPCGIWINEQNGEQLCSPVETSGAQCKDSDGCPYDDDCPSGCRQASHYQGETNG